jgi:hypothetical protein
MMKLRFVIPLVGPAISGAPGLTAFRRGLEELGTTPSGSVIAWSRRSMWAAVTWPTGRRWPVPSIRCCCGPSLRRRPAGSA